MKTLIISILFIAVAYTQQNDHAIYFENFESIEYEPGEKVNTLIFAVNNEKGMSRILIMKLGPDEYLFSRVYDGGHSEPSELDEGGVRAMMPTIIRYYVDKYHISLEQLDTVIKLIY